MSRYRKIDTRIWNDAKFGDFSDDGKLLFLYLLTHPNMTALGAMRSTLDGLASELGWLPERLSKAFGEPLSKGMVEHEEKSRTIALPNFIKYNQPESPNVVKAWAGCLDLIPEGPLKTRVIQRAKAFLDGKTKAFAEALPKDMREALSKAMPYQEQEQEQEQEPKSGALERGRGTYTHARAHTRAQGPANDAVTDPPRAPSMFTPYPIPSSPEAGKEFLIGKGVTPHDMDDCLRRMLGGNLSPFDLEGVQRGAA